VLGALAAAVGTRTLRSVLFDVAPSDLATFVSVVVFVTICAAVAAYIPGRRAARTKVNTLLRHF